MARQTGRVLTLEDGQLLDTKGDGMSARTLVTNL